MKKVFIAGHNGMVGSAILRKLKKKNIKLILKSHEELDLTNQQLTEKFFEHYRPDEVIIAAAKVGGINANNQYPAEFIYKNLQIQNNLIHISHTYNVQKLLFLGSSCIYPAYTSQPISENQLLSGTLESTNEPYAIAKIAGNKMCESYNRQYGRDYRSVMPTNLYGPGDNYHPSNSHVVPALIQRFHKGKINNSKEIIMWVAAILKREFLHVDDMADACVFIHNLSKKKYKIKTKSMSSHINIGTGQDISIKDLANMIKNVVGFRGIIKFNVDMPDGVPRKLLNTNLLNELGWKYKIDLKIGLQRTYEDFKFNAPNQAV